MTTTDSQNLDRSISAATQALLDCQRPDGEWCFELEADATIPSEYILFRHFLGEPIDTGMEGKIAVYLRRTQSAVHGGWPLFQDGDFDLSASLKAYFALKMIGESVEAPHMARARNEIRARGGAAGVNVFTKLMLALYGFIPWRAVPVMPTERSSQLHSGARGARSPRRTTTTRAGTRHRHPLRRRTERCSFRRDSGPTN